MVGEILRHSINLNVKLSKIVLFLDLANCGRIHTSTTWWNYDFTFTILFGTNGVHLA